MSNLFTNAITAGSPVGKTCDAAPTSDHSTFQALLERLQQFATTAPKPAAEPAAGNPAEALQQELLRADQSFTTAMDLRRQLEAAFHKNSP